MRHDLNQINGEKGEKKKKGHPFNSLSVFKIMPQGE